MARHCTGSNESDRQNHILDMMVCPRKSRESNVQTRVRYTRNVWSISIITQVFSSTNSVFIHSKETNIAMQQH